MKDKLSSDELHYRYTAYPLIVMLVLLVAGSWIGMGVIAWKLGPLATTIFALLAAYCFGSGIHIALRQHEEERAEGGDA